MNKYAVMPLADYVDSCDKIREKTGATDNIKSDEMPKKIDDVYGAGYSKGYADGEANGTGGDYNEGYADGKADAYAEVEPINAELEQTLYGTDTGGKSFYDEFWDAFQNNGERVMYLGAFADSSFEYIRPKYKICPYEKADLLSATVSFMFYGCLRLKKIEAKYFDFSRLPYTEAEGGVYDATFAFCESLTEIEDIGLSPSTYSVTFIGCQNLKTIAKITVDERVKFDIAFMECFALENIRFEGTIGQDGLNLQWSTKLSYDSIKSILDALSRTTTGLSITLSKAAVDKAFESSEGANDGSTSGQSEFVYYLHYEIPNWTVNLI